MAIKKTSKETLYDLTLESKATRGRVSDLTVLSFGGGQDSTALLLMYIHDESFRRDYAPGDLLVVMSDTGDEHDYTYAHTEKVRELCEKHEIPFAFLTADMGYHIPSWPDLITPQTRSADSGFKPTMVQLGTKSCTLNLKIGPIYKFLDEWINERYGYGFPLHSGGGCRKRALGRFYEENGVIRVLIGFAYGEEKRAVASRRQEIKDYQGSSWTKAVYREFPLIDAVMDRATCQAYIAAMGMEVPMPSNCVHCPYMSPAELLWMYRNERAAYDQWVEIEQRKMARDLVENQEREANGQKLVKSQGVFLGKDLIPDRLKKALEKFGGWTDEKLNQYKNSHGCGSSAY